MNDREVTHYLSDRYPLSRSDEEAWLRRAEANSFVDGLRVAIETKEGLPIGVAQLRETRAEDRKSELSIIIGEKAYWSKGYGTDALMTLLRFGFHEMNLHRVWLTTLEYNERAVACYRKCGFREEGRLRQEVFKYGRYWDYIIMGVLRDEFDALCAAPKEEDDA
jgi:RimJ/RimL family protein N-acetyltransferase